MNKVAASPPDLASTADFRILPTDLARDIQDALARAIAKKVCFPCQADPLVIFQYSLRNSIKEIESEQGELLRRFLLDGPYERGGPIPEAVAGQRLTDAETASAIAFVHGFMVNAFKGALAEMLALGPCVGIVEDLKQSGDIPADAQLYVGDAVLSSTKRNGFAKSSDMHILAVSPSRVLQRSEEH